MADQVIPQPLCAWNANGRLSAGAKATFFLSGTTTPATVYSDAAETVPHPSPLVADASGRFPPIYRSGVGLKCVLTDANDATLPGSPIDPVPIVRGAAGAADGITFDASADLAYTNVQSAIEGVFNSIRGQTKAFTAPVKVVAGTAAAPSIINSTDTNTGPYYPAADQWAVSTGGVNRLTMSNTAASFSVLIQGDGVRYAAMTANVVSGTANAIQLSVFGSTSRDDGQYIIFIPNSANTGSVTINVDGAGAQSCITVTGAALPANYLLPNIPVSAVFNGTAWVIDRPPEYASNANGEYWRYADGFQRCIFRESFSYTTTAAGAVYRDMTAAGTWTYPAAFAGNPGSANFQAMTNGAWGSPGNAGSASMNSRTIWSASPLTAISIPTTSIAEGRWY